MLNQLFFNQIKDEPIVYIKPHILDDSVMLEYYLPDASSKINLIAVSYDYKNELYPKLSSKNFDGIAWPNFIKLPVSLTKEEHFKFDQIEIDENPSTVISSRVSKPQYLTIVNEIKKRLQQGELYEMNYCMEFFAESKINPFETFIKLLSISKAPNACFLKINSKFLICGSPERFIKKVYETIVSEPIKGTKPRGENTAEDLKIKNELLHNKKEITENVMIVDLVRNDLSKIANPRTVSVEELCKIYSFNNVHQLISKISCKIDSSLQVEKILEATFPMGSMTGAPKYAAMNLAELYENTSRGIYSGTVGLVDEQNNFDLNVVIRSIVYNQETNYLSMQVGSAITINSVVEDEYQECLTKLQTMLKAINGKLLEHA